MGETGVEKHKKGGVSQLLAPHVSASHAVVSSTIVVPLAYAEREPAPPLPSGTLTAEPVPAAVRPQPVPMVRLLLPLVMVLAFVGMMGLMVLNSRNGSGGIGAVLRNANPGMLVFPLMMLMSVATMFAPQQADDPDETRRIFMRHIGVLRAKALKNGKAQRTHELHKHPDPAFMWSHVGSRRMWERNANDPDALEIRMGVGATRLCTPIDVQDSGAAEDLDPVCAVALRHTVRSVGTLEKMPISIQLRAFRFLGISGPHAADMARALVLQLVFHHGPESVGIKVLGGGWEWVKWLPHTRTIDYAAYRILIVDSVTTTGVESFIDDPYWTTIIDVGSHEHTALGARARDEGLCLSVEGDELIAHTMSGPEPLGSPDLITEDQARAVAKAMNAYRRPADTDSATASGDFLSLLGVGSIDQLTPGTLWQPHTTPETARQRLVVPLGLGDTGRPLLLDLKESAHGGVGPHGLCIGATGSGKSELLKTLVLALAVTHSPEELNFVLVDFKGGATFLGLDRLPHTSAIITNLAEESTLVERMHDAISGELNRRQEVLRASGNYANVHDYNKARADNPDLEPLPALLIVLDEFSELLAQHPDFADLFVAVGRLGRSLHIHLLLASQRLEEGRLRGLDSHLSYRIGLKTFSAAESRQVLGVVDAYHLPARPGAGYIKTDAEEVTRFQASYVSGPLPSSAATAVVETCGIRVFTDWESIAPPEVIDSDDNLDEEHSDTHEDTTTLLDAVADIAQEAGRQQGVSAHTVWLPPLPATIPLSEVIAARDAAADATTETPATCDWEAAIGIIDRPYHQRQDPLILSFTGTGGHAAICGGPQTGKTTALRTIVLSLAVTHPTSAVRFYVLDLAGTALATLARIPHVAGVAHRNDPEKVQRIVDEVLGFIDEPDDRHTFLIVDGWHTVGTDFDHLVDSFNRIAADGLAAGVHLVASTQRWTAMRPAIRDLISHRIELRLGEAMDSLIDRKAQLKLPHAPGRGLTTDGEPMLIALSTNQDIEYVRMSAEQQGQSPVPPLRVLPPQIHRAEICTGNTDVGKGILIGLGGPKLSPQTWVPSDAPHVLCLGSQGSGKSTFIATMAAGITELGRDAARMVVIDHRRTHLGAFDEAMMAVYSATSQATDMAVANMVTTLTSRLPGSDVTAQELRDRSWWTGPDIYLLIDDYDLVQDGAFLPLKSLIPHARDIGFHVVVSRKSGGAQRALYDPFLSEIRDQSPAVMLLNIDREEGVLFGVKPVQQPPGRGTLVNRGAVVGVCQVAQP